MADRTIDSGSLAYWLPCWWLDSPRVERLGRYVERRAA